MKPWLYTRWYPCCNLLFFSNSQISGKLMTFITISVENFSLLSLLVHSCVLSFQALLFLQHLHSVSTLQFREQTVVDLLMMSIFIQILHYFPLKLFYIIQESLKIFFCRSHLRLERFWCIFEWSCLSLKASHHPSIKWKLRGSHFHPFFFF